MDEYIKSLLEKIAEQQAQTDVLLQQIFSKHNIANPILKDVCEETVAAESQERCSDDIQQRDHGIILEGGSHFRHSI